MDRLDLLAVQGTRESLLQHDGSKVSILWPILDVSGVVTSHSSTLAWKIPWMDLVALGVELVYLFDFFLVS